MRRGEFYRVRRPPGDPKPARVFVVVSRQPLVSPQNIPLGIGARDVRRDPWGRVGRVADELQGVPMFDGLPIVVEPINIDTGDTCVRGIVGQKIQEVHVREHVVADGDDPVHDTRARSCDRE